MANWKNTLEISDIWKLAEDGEITPEEFGRRLAERLKPLNPQLAEGFEALPLDADFDDVDQLLDELYDWGDRGHRCWVERWKLPAEVAS